jgi:hypothetical protein
MTEQLCQCEPQSFPFECARHGCIKTEHWWNLCQTREDYFQLWEEGRGPGQHTTMQEPGLLRKAANFGKAVVKHVASGRKVVDEQTYQARLETCRDCPSLDQDKMVCREKTCGCYVERKAKWASQQCPLEKWLAVTDRHQNSEAAGSEPSGEDDIPQKGPPTTTTPTIH